MIPRARSANAARALERLRVIALHPDWSRRRKPGAFCQFPLKGDRARISRALADESKKRTSQVGAPPAFHGGCDRASHVDASSNRCLGSGSISPFFPLAKGFRVWTAGGWWAILFMSSRAAYPLKAVLSRKSLAPMSRDRSGAHLVPMKSAELICPDDFPLISARNSPSDFR